MDSGRTLSDLLGDARRCLGDVAMQFLLLTRLHNFISRVPRVNLTWPDGFALHF